jgi:hypothetical protein
MSESFSKQVISAMGFVIIYTITEFLIQMPSLKFAWNISTNSFKNCKFLFDLSVLE